MAKRLKIQGYYIDVIANEIKLYVEEYGGTHEDAADAFDEPVPAEVITQALKMIGVTHEV